MLCRLCVNESTELLDMCKLYYGETPAITYIVEVLDIKMDSENTALVMCSGCNTALSNFHSFCRIVREAQHRYNEMFDLKPHLAAEHKYLDTYCMKEEFGDDDECGEFGEVLINIEDIVECKGELIDDNFDHIPSTSKETRGLSPGIDSDNYNNGKTVKSRGKRKINKAKKNTEMLMKSMQKIARESLRGNSTNNKKQNRFARKEIATKTLLSKYKMEEISLDRKWVLPEKQREEVLPLYLDMKCMLCTSSTFVTYAELDQHSFKDHGSPPTLKCCRNLIYGREELETHILYVHILKIDAPKKYKILQCPVCNKSVRHTILKFHLATHLPNDKREFICDYCQRGFCSKAQIMTHIVAKHSEINFACEICGKKFPTKVRLKYHIQNVHEETAHFLCPECGKKIKTLANYKEHVNEHRGMAIKVKCHLCDSVIKKSCLSNHMRTHNPKKQKQCPHCSYKAVQIHEHIKRVHKKVRPFTCSFCPMTFYNEKTMSDHIASRHTGIPGYACEFCSKTFMSSGNYHSHCKRMHPTQLAEKKMKRANEINTGDIRDSQSLKKPKTILEGAEADLIIQDIHSMMKKPQPAVGAGE